MSGNFAMPNIVWEDKYFNESRVFSRREALAWIAKHVRWTDNCVLKRGQGSWSLRYLADAWGWTRPRVQRFLARLESMNVIRLAVDTVADTAQTVITYLFSTTYGDEKDNTDTEAIQKRYRTVPKTNTGNQKKEDSCQSQAPDQPPQEDPARAFWPDDDPVENGAGPSKPATGDYGKSNMNGAGNPKQATEHPDEQGAGSSPPKPGAPLGSGRRADYPAEFEQFWRTCPSRLGGKGSKAKPYAYWRKAKADERAAMLRGAELWAKRAGKTLSEFTPMVSTWVNQRRWEVEMEMTDAEKKRSERTREEAWL